jgi:signal transduction histidine kinase
MFSSVGWVSRRQPRRSWVKRRLPRTPSLRSVSLAVLGLLQLGWNVRRVVTVRRLRAASHRAADDASAKSLFLRLASHEIRAPLALARGYVDIIRSETLGPINIEIGEALGSVDQKLGQIEELVMQMVETARLDVGGPGLRPTPLDMRHVVEDAVAQITEQLGPQHDLVVSLTDQPAIVMAERFRLRTLLVNLLSNAIKYSPEGGEVRCTLRERRRQVEVIVADRGIGLDPAQLRRVFQPFTRLPEGEKVASSGLGLGLHLAQTIAEAHGGTLTAGANPGGGAIFTVSLPKAR